MVVGDNRGWTGLELSKHGQGAGIVKGVERGFYMELESEGVTLPTCFLLFIVDLQDGRV